MRKWLIGAALSLAALGLAGLAAVEAQIPPPINTATNCSGTITSGGTAQSLIPAGGAKHGYQIQNLSTDMLAFSEFTATPATLTNGSWTLAAGTASAPGGSYNTPDSYAAGGAVFIIGATTSDKFTCEYW